MSETRYAINFGLKQTLGTISIVPDSVEFHQEGSSESCVQPLLPGDSVCVVYAHYEYADKFNSMVAGSIVPLCVVPNLYHGVQLIRELWAMLQSMPILSDLSTVTVPGHGVVDVSFMTTLPKNAKIKLRANTATVR